MNFTGKISGTVLEANSDKPVEYANITLFSKRDSSLITGTITDNRGRFRLDLSRPGRFILEVKFIGFKAVWIDTIKIGPRHADLTLAPIRLKPVVLQGQEVNVTTGRPAVEYKLDKKVLNVRQELTSISGSAVDVLENVPSVSVDFNGNVQLRGSSSFTVLIDNRPTALDASEALQQIPATEIENIEIITNPSAKYDPDGITGIINVITRKNRLEGISGLFNSNRGSYDQYGGDFLLGYRSTWGTFSLGANLDRRTHPGTIETENRTTLSNQTTSVLSTGTSDFQRQFTSVKGEWDWPITEQDNLTLSFRSGLFEMSRGSEQNFTIDSPLNIDWANYSNSSSWERSGLFLSATGDYLHHFSKKGHEVSLQYNYRQFDGDELAITKSLNPGNEIFSGQRTTEKGPNHHSRIQLNYIFPFSETSRFEGGYQLRMGKSQDITTFANYDTLMESFIDLDAYAHDVSYSRNIQSLYSILAKENDHLSIQIGLREEYTGRTISVTDAGDTYTIDRWDLFPSVHSSWNISPVLQIMGSYSRRINRPRGWYLEPFMTWTDDRNVREGNAGLLPEYIDSYETSIQRSMNKSVLSLEGYYRRRFNVIEEFRSVYQDTTDIIFHQYQNAGTSESVGVEAMLSLRHWKWWNLNLTTNVYTYTLTPDSEFNLPVTSSSNWSLRINNTFILGSNTRIQLSGRYNSPTVTSQGKRSGNSITSLAIRQKFMDKKLSLTVQINDLFQTSRWETTSEGENFYSYSLMNRDAPVVVATLTYNFHNYRQKRSPRNGNDESVGEDF
ncbi:MAG: TonB-dependent receptor [FCB group bacterium]|nr:TonB-dependent receptor [FCB group bacterium]